MAIGEPASRKNSYPFTRVRGSTLRMAQRARSEEAWKYSTQITLPGAFQLKGLCVDRGLWTLGTLPGHKRAASDTDLTPFKPHFFHLLNGLTVPASQDSGRIMWEQEAQALLSHHHALLLSSNSTSLTGLWADNVRTRSPGPPFPPPCSTSVKAVYCHPAYLTYTQSTSWDMLGWMKHKLESRLLGEISVTSDVQMTPPLWQKVKRN